MVMLALPQYSVLYFVTDSQHLTISTSFCAYNHGIVKYRSEQNIFPTFIFANYKKIYVKLMLDFAFFSFYTFMQDICLKYTYFDRKKIKGLASVFVLFFFFYDVATCCPVYQCCVVSLTLRFNPELFNSEENTAKTSKINVSFLFPSANTEIK